MVIYFLWKITKSDFLRIKMKEITKKASLDSIPEITDFVNECLESMDCPMKTQFQIDIAIDEILSNVANYAYPGKDGDVTICLDDPHDGYDVTIRFEDSGIPFNPLQLPDPDLKSDADDRKIGGLGIFLVKQNMDSVQYEFKDGKNSLTIHKMFR